MTASVRLPSLAVEGFRAIRSLRLPRLADVNLFVGKNNAGKSSLLEAVQLYAHRNSKSLATAALEIVRNHSDLRSPSFAGRRPELEAVELQAVVEAVEALFFGSFDERALRRIYLTPETMGETGLSIALPWTTDFAPGEEEHAPTRPMLVDPAVAALEFASEATTTELPLGWFLRRYPLQRTGRRSVALFVPSTGIEPFRLRQIWDSVAVAGEEDLISDALRPLVPTLAKILLIGDSGNRTILCRLTDAARPVPLRSMGDGVNRVFSLAVAIVHARDGIVLIDEVENGLHHSVQGDVWRSIFRLSRQMNVQVFATTHSWESVDAFQAAAVESPSSGMLYRLEREEDGSVYAEQYSEQDVAVAAEHHVEVR